MEIFENISDLKDASKPSVLTIGMFDGVHIGHQQILKRLNLLKNNGTSCVITFKEHPHNILYPNDKIPLIYSLEHRLERLKDFNVDFVLLFEFSKSFANISFDTFLTFLKNHLNFSKLILGEKASFGKNKLGIAKNIKSLENHLQFNVEYLPKVFFKNNIISSSYIRKLIREKQYKIAYELLNQKGSICQLAYPVR